MYKVDTRGRMDEVNNGSCGARNWNQDKVEPRARSQVDKVKQGAMIRWSQGSASGFRSNKDSAAP